MEPDAIETRVNTAFRVALLLGCDSSNAEAAVLDGIIACEDSSCPSLLIEAIGSTLRRRADCTDARAPLQLLAPGLHPLFKLPPLLRDCFVLRILLKLSSEACVGLLNISVGEFENASFAALNRLPFLFLNVDLAGNQSHPTPSIGPGEKGRIELSSAQFARSVPRKNR